MHTLIIVHGYELIRVKVHLLTGGSPCVMSGVWLIELRLKAACGKWGPGAIDVTRPVAEQE